MKRKQYLCIALVVAMTCFSVACGSKAPVATTPETTEAETTQVEVVETEEETTEEALDPAKDNVEGVNLLTNGDFEAGSENWGTFITRGGVAEFAVLEGVGTFDIMALGTDNYSVQLYYDEFPLKFGGVYEFSFDMASDIPRNVQARIQLNGGDYKGYVESEIDITTEMTTYAYTFEMEDSDPLPRLCFNIGKPKNGDQYDKHKVMIDNVCVKLIDGSKLVEEEVVDLSVDCNTNQVGFYPDGRKTVVISSENPGKEFNVVDMDGNVVYTGKLGDAIDNTLASGEIVYQGDFSDFTTPGTYKIVSADGKESYPFEIAEGIYTEVLKDTFRMLYLQRCGCEVTEDIAGNFAHPVCHNTDAVIYGTDKTKEVNGGWHDAGDFGRYVVPGAQTIQDLFLSYEDFPEIWDGPDGDNMGIPESGNGVPDILDEAKYELDWMIKMQDEETGGVYHKVTCKEFPGFVMPQEETETLYLSPISTAATADFAAVMAKSSEVYKDIDPDFAAKALVAAEKAWGYLKVTKNIAGFRNPDDVLTGEYPDGQDKDERFWAAAELYKVTGKDEYRVHLEETMEKYILQGYGWAEMGSYGLITYLSLDDSMKNPTYVAKIEEMVVKKADEMVGYAKADGYNAGVGSYVWGSNLSICNSGRQMLFAAELTGKDEYRTYAYDQVQYILGQNAVSYCFVTGYGSLQAQHTHHRPSIVQGETMKGMVIGGPNGNLEDPFAKAILAGQPPAKCYLDHDQSFSTNEVTIYWNSPFIYLLSSQTK